MRKTEARESGSQPWKGEGIAEHRVIIARTAGQGEMAGSRGKGAGFAVGRVIPAGSVRQGKMASSRRKAKVSRSKGQERSSAETMRVIFGGRGWMGELSLRRRRSLTTGMPNIRLKADVAGFSRPRRFSRLKWVVASPGVGTDLVRHAA